MIYKDEIEESKGTRVERDNGHARVNMIQLNIQN